MNIQLIIIDPQNDFMDTPESALPVPGATEDMKRLATMVRRLSRKLDDIHVTLDSHHTLDVAHPSWWVDQNENHPAPFTIITRDDVENGVWRTSVPSLQKRGLEYVRALEQGGKNLLCIWPEHCLIGTPGHNVQPDLFSALQEWERENKGMVEYITKGSNPFTEHYGALMAEVPDPNDPGTGLNTSVLQTLSEADIVLVAGEALSHCVKETVSQIAENIGDEHISKFHILTDCSSPVPAVPNGPDFPAIAQAWLKEMEAKGMKLVTSTEFMF